MGEKRGRRAMFQCSVYAESSREYNYRLPVDASARFEHFGVGEECWEQKGTSHARYSLAPERFDHFNIRMKWGMGERSHQPSVVTKSAGLLEWIINGNGIGSLIEMFGVWCQLHSARDELHSSVGSTRENALDLGREHVEYLFDEVTLAAYRWRGAVMDGTLWEMSSPMMLSFVMEFWLMWRTPPDWEIICYADRRNSYCERTAAEVCMLRLTEAMNHFCNSHLWSKSIQYDIRRVGAKHARTVRAVMPLWCYPKSGQLSQ